MDQAILRPGRLGRLLYVPLPSPDERVLILKALARKKPVDSSVDLMTIGRDDACKNFSGADLAALVCSSFNMLVITCLYHSLLPPPPHPTPKKKEVKKIK